MTSINGYTFETMESILYAALGYESFDQVIRWTGVKKAEKVRAEFEAIKEACTPKYEDIAEWESKKL